MIVDDENGAINSLRTMLTEYCPQIQVVAAAQSITEAVRAVASLQPELVFLDIEMPPLGSGFDFLKNCEDVSFGVIFTTAYPQYAVKAINTIQPWAYLIKPYSVSELREAVKIATEKIAEQNRSFLQAAGRQGLVLNDSRKGTIVLTAGSILFCKADGSLTDFYILKNHRVEKMTMSGHLGEFESRLPKALFCRTHHSFLVNMGYVERIERTGRNGIVYLSHTDLHVDVSVSKMEYFINCLDAFYERTNKDAAAS